MTVDRVAAAHLTERRDPPRHHAPGLRREDNPHHHEQCQDCRPFPHGARHSPTEDSLRGTGACDGPYDKVRVSVRMSGVASCCPLVRLQAVAFGANSQQSDDGRSDVQPVVSLVERQDVPLLTDCEEADDPHGGVCHADDERDHPGAVWTRRAPKGGPARWQCAPGCGTG